MATVAIIAPGKMGAAIGHRLGDGGARVLTSLAGRSRASRDRAAAAGMTDADVPALAASDIILSVLPPSEALALAESLAPALAAADRKPVYVDCNAVSPETVRAIAGRIGATGCPFVDIGIIGPPPAHANSRTVLYASGEDAWRLNLLGEAGLTIRTLAGPVGTASALKMSYAGVTKGLTALGTAMALAATGAGVGEALARQLGESEPEMSVWLKHAIPGMFAKAYRFDGEMREIARFVAADGGPAAIYEGAAALFASLARDVGGARVEMAKLEAFVALLPET